MKKLTVLIDLDGIVADLVRPWLRFYNATWDDNLTIGDITGFEVRDFVKPEAKKAVFEYFGIPGVFRQLPVIPGSKEAVRYLNQHHKVLFCTSPPNGQAAAEKYEWVEENFGFDHKQVIMCSQKEYVAGDVLIDDKPTTAYRYRTEWPRAKVVSIKYPYNAGDPHFHLLADDFVNTRNAWKLIVEYIKDLAA